MAERTRKDDFAELLTVAAGAINDALHDGDSHGHYPGEWLTESVEHQLKHIRAHVAAYLCGDTSEDHLSHIVCRAAFAYALRQRLSR